MPILASSALDSTAIAIIRQFDKFAVIFGSTMINPEARPQFSRPAAGRSLPITNPTPPLYTIPVLLLNDILALGVSLFIAWEARLGLLPVFGPLFSLEVTVDFYHHLLWSWWW